MSNGGQYDDALRMNGMAPSDRRHIASAFLFSSSKSVMRIAAMNPSFEEPGLAWSDYARAVGPCLGTFHEHTTQTRYREKPRRAETVRRKTVNDRGLHILIIAGLRVCHRVGVVSGRYSMLKRGRYSRARLMRGISDSSSH